MREIEALSWFWLPHILHQPLKCNSNLTSLQRPKFFFLVKSSPENIVSDWRLTKFLSCFCTAIFPPHWCSLALVAVCCFGGYYSHPGSCYRLRRRKLRLSAFRVVSSLLPCHGWSCQKTFCWIDLKNNSITVLLACKKAAQLWQSYEKEEKKICCMHEWGTTIRWWHKSWQMLDGRAKYENFWFDEVVEWSEPVHQKAYKQAKKKLVIKTQKRCSFSLCCFKF